MAPIRQMLVADLSGGFDEPLIRYSARIAAMTEAGYSLVLPPAAALRLNSNSSRVRELCARENAPEPLYRMLLEPDIASLFDLAWHCEADVVLLRYSSHSAASRRLARRVIRSAPCSVWLLPEGHEGRLSKVVAGFSLNDAGAHVVESAAALAKAAAADALIAAHVWLDPTHLDPTDTVHQTLRLEQIRTARRFLWKLDLAGVECAVRLEHSVSRAQPLLHVAAESAADLLVIPTPEVSSVGFALHRDQTDMFLRAGIPVLNVRVRNEYRATFSEVLRDLFYYNEPAFG